MNQDQRKYLIELVSRTHRNQKEKIESEVPKKPSLNNYLVAACLDGTIKLRDVASIREKVRQRVLKFDKNDVLIAEDDSWDRRNKRKGDVINKVELEAEDLFIIPKAYEKALDDYNKAKVSIEKRIEDLDAQKETIIMKVQIGSAQALSRLVTEVDNIADLSLMNSQLLLSDKSSDKKAINEHT